MMPCVCSVIDHRLHVRTSSNTQPWPRVPHIFCSSFRGMKRLLPRWDAGPTQGSPSVKFAGTHFVRVKCLGLEHNTIFPGQGTNPDHWIRIRQQNSLLSPAVPLSTEMCGFNAGGNPTMD